MSLRLGRPFNRIPGAFLREFVSFWIRGDEPVPDCRTERGELGELSAASIAMIGVAAIVRFLPN